jgi:nitrogen fixation NifU-like protein
MSHVNELYQETILDHNKNPRNFRKIENPTCSQEGFNPLCGDHLHLYLKLENDVIKDISFEGNGCAISKSSASLMTSVLKGKTVEEAEILFEKFHKLVTSTMDEEQQIDELGKLAVFAGVREFPARVKCASLAWHTLKAALDNDQKPVTTE